MTYEQTKIFMEWSYWSARLLWLSTPTMADRGFDPWRHEAEGHMAVLFQDFANTTASAEKGGGV